LGEAVALAARQAGFAVDWARDGVQAESALAGFVYDAMLLDLGLPRREGLEVLRNLRKRGATLPVMILTARDTVEDRVRGLDAGADDYLLKPFSLDELLARLRALMRRAHGVADTSIRMGHLCFDSVKRQASVADTPLVGWDEAVGDNAVEVYIHRLRRKLAGSGVAIRTLRGLGYLLETEH
jgi:DNA-binding response OmpR family regulator